MANMDDAMQPLLSQVKDSSLIFKEQNALQRRRFRHSIKAHIANIRYPEQNGVQSHPWLESLLEKNKLSFFQVFILLGLYLGVGTLCFGLVMNQIEGKKTHAVLDAIYLCVVTMTTVGYGDLVPNSVLSKLLASLYVFTGMALVGIILSKAADYIAEKQEILLVKAMHLHEKIGSTEILKEVETNKVKYKFLLSALLLSLLIVLGTVFLCIVENLAFVDALYCVCSTITTLGYGDKSFSTTKGRVFAVFWILSSTICLAQFFLYLAELYTDERQKSLAKWVLTRDVTSSDLEAADLDHNRVVSAAEFIVYTMKEMGKISDEDISLVMERFKKLDVDRSGTLTESDLRSSQSS